MRYAIGIDPGSTGAIAIVSEDFAAAWHVDTKDAASVHEIIFKEADVSQGDKCLACIERVQAMPGGGERRMGATSAFKFGQSFGVPQGVLVALRIPMQFVTPSTWQKTVGALGKSKGQDRKELIRKAARERWPSVEMHRKKDQALADALFIARWALKEGI